MLGLLSAEKIDDHVIEDTIMGLDEYVKEFIDPTTIQHLENLSFLKSLKTYFMDYYDKATHRFPNDPEEDPTLKSMEFTQWELYE